MKTSLHWTSHDARLSSCLLATLLLATALSAQTSQLLRLESIAAGMSEPVQFTFVDQGSGATNYLVEVSASVGLDASWSVDNQALIFGLGGNEYRVETSSTESFGAYYRIVGLGGTGGPIVVEFATTAFEILEGGALNPVLRLSAPFQGMVRYTVSGTAASGDYVALSGEVLVDGVSAEIAVVTRENEQIGELRNLTLSLAAGAGYQVGRSAQTTIDIKENDAEWQGQLEAGQVEMGFVLSIIEGTSGRSGALVSNGLGLVPAGVYPAQIATTQTSFSTSVTGIPLDAEASLVGEPMALSLELQAQSGVEGQLVAASRIEGSYTLSTMVPSRPHLSRSRTGRFVLLKPPGKPSTQELELVDIP